MLLGLVTAGRFPSLDGLAARWDAIVPVPLWVVAAFGLLWVVFAPKPSGHASGMLKPMLWFVLVVGGLYVLTRHQGGL